MIGDDHSLTEGHLARHTPRGPSVSDEVARLDVAQDFLLAHFADLGLFEQIAFKGGTALRKLYAGNAGRFSTDLDLALRDPAEDRAALTAIIADAATGKFGPFSFRVEKGRGERWQIAVTSEFGPINLRIKLDVGAPCWLTPEMREYVSIPIHQRYGFTLPQLPCMRLEEIIAEKIARLTRMSTARDAFDLVWLATTSPYSAFDRDLVRRLAVLKIWVDNNGLRPGWIPTIAPKPFSTIAWFEPRDNWDDEQIGMLTSPPPALVDLERRLTALYSWLGTLSEEEARWAKADPRDLASVIQAICALPNGALTDSPLY